MLYPPELQGRMKRELPMGHVSKSIAETMTGVQYSSIGSSRLTRRRIG